MSKISLLTFTALLLLSSCGNRVSEKRTPAPGPQRDALENSDIKILEKQLADMDSDGRSVDLPKAGAILEYIANYSIEKETNQKIDGTNVYCSFKFQKAKITEEVTEVTGTTYKIKETLRPIDSTYQGSVDGWEEQCRKYYEDGNKTRDVAKEMTSQLKAFKTFFNR